jgi:hypothetical protein
MFDDEDYPLIAWAADRDVWPDPRCGTCWGSGADGSMPCRCLADAVRATFLVAADEAEPHPRCPVCAGSGEDDEAETCRCTLRSLRAGQEELENADSAPDVVTGSPVTAIAGREFPGSGLRRDR